MDTIEKLIKIVASSRNDHIFKGRSRNKTIRMIKMIKKTSDCETREEFSKLHQEIFSELDRIRINSYKHTDNDNYRYFLKELTNYLKVWNERFETKKISYIIKKFRVILDYKTSISSTADFIKHQNDLSRNTLRRSNPSVDLARSFIDKIKEVD